MHLNTFFWRPSFSLSNIHILFYAPKPLCPFSPLCVEIRLQQWTLRVMVMECIWGASSFLSPTCMQNHPNRESLAPVYNTERGASTMVTPLLSIKPLADRSAQSPPVKTFFCWIKKKAEEKKNWLKVCWHTSSHSGSLFFNSCFMFLDLEIKFMSMTEWKMPL